MHWLFRPFVPALGLLAGAGAAFAGVLTLNEPVELRAKPGANRPVVATAPAGAEVSVIREGREWTTVVFEGRRFYAPAVRLAETAPSDAPGPDPSCDYGYPYSGSGQFFARPLARARHGEPLGFLFGYHWFYPC